MEVDVKPFASVLPYGTLQFQESYFDYQGPRFFSMRSTLGVYVFATCIDENDSDEPEYSTWLLLVVSEQRFQSIQSGKMSMLDAYRKADQGMIWKVDFEKNGSKSSRNVSFNEIPERFLPSKDSFLAMSTEMDRRNESDEIVSDPKTIQRNKKEHREQYQAGIVSFYERAHTHIKTIKQLSEGHPSYVTEVTLSSISTPEGSSAQPHIVITRAHDSRSVTEVTARQPVYKKLLAMQGKTVKATFEKGHNDSYYRIILNSSSEPHDAATPRYGNL